MAKLTKVRTLHNRVKDFTVSNKKAGSISIFEDFDIGFTPKRVYWLYDFLPDEIRAGHKHVTTKHALICVTGGCEVYVNNGTDQRGVTFKLNHPHQCLLLEAKDWHTMQKFKKGTVLLVLASTNYKSEDYIYEPYT